MITIVDYGAGNLRSVVNAIIKLGYQPKVTSNPGDLVNAQAVILLARPLPANLGNGSRRLRLDISAIEFFEPFVFGGYHYSESRASGVGNRHPIRYTCAGAHYVETLVGIAVGVLDRQFLGFVFRAAVVGELGYSWNIQQLSNVGKLGDAVNDVIVGSVWNPAAQLERK